MKKLLMCCAIFLLLQSAVQAQSEEKFTNLQVLDSAISKDELIGYMKMMSQSLGVRCEFCHVENNIDGKREKDFASDEKDHKKITRTMMIMTKDINESHLSKLLAMGESHVDEVTCFTCHHNDKKPRVLQDVMMQAIERNGADSAIVKYHALHDEYYGASVYDFSENTLSAVAVELAENEKFDDAFKILDLNASQYPESLNVKQVYVHVYMASGQKDKAREMCNEILKIEPENRRVQRMLKQLSEKE